MSSDLLIRIDGTSAGFDAAASTAQKAALRLEATLKTAATAQGLLNKAVAEFGAGSAEATAAGKAYEASLSKVAAAEDRAAIASKRATEQMARDNAARTASAEAASKKQAAALKKVGSAYGAVGLAAVAGLALAAKAAAQFDAKQAQIASLSRTATAGQLAALRQASFGYANIGASASDAADAEIELVKAGISVKDQLGGALAGTLNLAAAGQIAVGDAASIAAQAMTQFQLSGKDIPHVADLLAAGADRAIGSVQDLGDGLHYAGLTAHQLGLSVGDTVGVLAEFAQAGLIGSQGGAALQQMLLRLENPTSKSADLMSSLGISLYDASGKFAGMTNLAVQLHDKLSGLTLQQRLSTLATLFGSRAVRAANVLYQDGAAGVASWQKKVDAAGFAAKQAAGKMNSLSGDFSKLKAQLTNTGIALGEQLQGPLRTVVRDLTGVLKVIGDLPGPLKQAAALTLAFTAVVGAGVFVYSRAEAKLLLLRTNLGLVGTAFTEAGTKAEIASGRLLLIRGASALAGIGLLTLASNSKGAASSIEGIGAAALIGNSILPGWGAAIGAGGAALYEAVKASGYTTTSIGGLTATLDKNTGAWGKNSQAAAFQVALKNKPVLDALGLSMDTYTKALLGNANAQGAVYLAAKKNSLIAPFIIKPLDDAIAAAKNASDAFNAYWSTFETKVTPAQLRASKAIRAMGGTMLDTSGDVYNYAKTVDTTTTSTAALASETAKLILQIQGLDNNVLTQRAAFTALQGSIAGASKAAIIAAVGAKAYAASLGNVTKAGTPTGIALDGVAQSALQAEKGMTGAALIKFNNDNHDKLVALAIALGASTTQADNYAQHVLHTMIPATDQATKHINATTTAAQNLGNQQPNVKVTSDTAAAQAAIDKFVRDTNTSLGHIAPETVPVTLSAQTSKVLAQLGAGGTLMATGGAVSGGIPGRDSVPILAMPGEHVWTTAEVQAAGGHGAMLAMRQAVRIGGLPRYSDGGAILGTSIGVTPMAHGEGLGVAVARVESLFGTLVDRIGTKLSSKIASLAQTAAQAAATGAVAGLGGGLGVSVGHGLFRPANGPLTQGLHDQWTGFPAVDVGVGVGTPVHAGAAGRVTSSYDIPGSGNYGYASYGRVIQLLHSGFSTLYAHLSQRGVNVGQTIAGGSTIGLSGDTGNSTGPHLHFGAQGISPYAFGYDQGGALPPGYTLAYNGLGHHETTLPYPPEVLLRALKASAISGHMGGRSQVIVQQVAFPDRVTLLVDGHPMTALIQREATNVVKDYRTLDANQAVGVG